MASTGSVPTTPSCPGTSLSFVVADPNAQGAAVRDIMVPAQPGGVYCDLTIPPTLVGQNTQPPSEKIFAAHFIVKPTVSGVPTYVDPSYGVTYNGASGFQSSAIFGYFDFNQPLISNTGTTYYLVTAPDPANPGITITP